MIEFSSIQNSNLSKSRIAKQKRFKNESTKIILEDIVVNLDNPLLVFQEENTTKNPLSRKEAVGIVVGGAA